MLLKYWEYIKENSTTDLHKQSDRVLIDIVNKITKEELKEYISGSIDKMSYNKEIVEDGLNDDINVAINSITNNNVGIDDDHTDIESIIDYAWEYIEEQRDICYHEMCSMPSGYCKQLIRIAHWIIGFKFTWEIPQHPKFEIVKIMVEEIVENSPIILNLHSVKRSYAGGSPYRISYEVSIEYGGEEKNKIKDYLYTYKDELSKNGLKIYNVWPMIEDEKMFVKLEIVEQDD